jgi:hypothetical protein
MTPDEEEEAIAILERMDARLTEGLQRIDANLAAVHALLAGGSKLPLPVTTLSGPMAWQALKLPDGGVRLTITTSAPKQRVLSLELDPRQVANLREMLDRPPLEMDAEGHVWVREEE